MESFFTLRWTGDYLIIIDQKLLPNEIVYLELKTVDQVFNAICTMQVRGAPAIGITAGYGMVMAADQCDQANFLNDYKKWGDYLNQARPTAVNLKWAVDRMVNIAKLCDGLLFSQLRQRLLQEAVAIHNEDIKANKLIGENLLSLLKEGDSILTHCNAGALATSEYGTALSVFYLAKERGISLKVFADETRPRLQGAKLTVFELKNSGIDVTLITDNMAAMVMSQGKIDAVIVGCDRIAANGDTANKIGTLNVSIIAKYFNIPFYIAAPTSTIDMNCLGGGCIPIEERSSDEILRIGEIQIAPKGVNVYNPAFDITPGENITAIVTEKGIARPPYHISFKELL